MTCKLLKPNSLEMAKADNPITDNLAQWFEIIPAGLIVINEEGVIHQFNQAAAEIFQRMKINDEWRNVITQNIKEIIGNGDYIQCYSGKHILFKTQSLPNKKGQLVLLLDETTLKNNSEAEIKRQKLQSIERLSATLAHQLRTPLSTAILYASNLNVKKASDDEIAFYQNKILEQLTLIKEQIDEVLLTSKNEVGFINKIDLKSEILALMNTYNELHPDVHFKLNCKTEHNYSLLGNKAALRGAFSNIIDNAIEASIPQKNITINLRYQEGAICLEVIDYGIGIRNENIQKILEPFYTTKENGTGIGLTIAKSIIEAHQGKLMIESIENKLTKMSAIFPAIYKGKD